MSRASLQRALQQGDRILLDSTVLIAYLNGNERVSPIAAEIIDSFVKSGRNQAVVSMISAMEILVRPLRGDPGRTQHAFDFLRRTPNVVSVPVDLPTAHQAAMLRAFFPFKPPDALTIASGLVHGVAHLVTNDAHWKVLPGTTIRVCYIADHLPFP